MCVGVDLASNTVKFGRGWGTKMGLSHKFFAAAAFAFGIIGIVSPSIAATVLFDSGPPCCDGVAADVYPTGSGSLGSQDFSLTANASIIGANVYIAGFGGIGAWTGAINYFIFADASGLPGAILSTGAGQVVSVSDIPSTLRLHLWLRPERNIGLG